MNDLDLLSGRLNELSRHAPAPAVDPLADVRRGQKALRRSRVRVASGLATVLVAAGAVALTAYLPNTPENPGSGSLGTDLPRIQVGSDDLSSLCLDTFGGLRTQFGPSDPLPDPRTPAAGHPAVAPQLNAYRQAAAAILDPSGAHLDAEVTNTQYSCWPPTGELRKLGTKLGWSSSGALGVVQIEVVSGYDEEDSQIILPRGGWTPIEGSPPDGVIAARKSDYAGGHAVSVQREDGYLVTIDANGTFDNNAPPGSPPVTDLPAIDKLLELAADEALVLPTD